MAAVLYSASGPDGNSATVQSTTVGGSKPLHRFIKGEPKIVGIIVLVLGTTYIIVSVATWIHDDFVSWTAAFQPGIVQGAMFVFCGILYILTEHNPTKKTVTVSLALSIVTLPVTCWTILYFLLNRLQNEVMHYEFIHHDNDTLTVKEEPGHYEVMMFSVEVIHLFYCCIGVLILIGMSALAGAALRSTKSQAIVVMTPAPPE
ncbi:uncharacterized protein LOC117526144 isoform X2 [Thalassophryne amazonica]|nr:uncharacterized protein LOC117526144 isoform X2 [Thalassophryne amazonica]XP_034044081.1 uncharacterized protein LOC117526144 isoform X2 [Thalassophryne amazonica]